MKHLGRSLAVSDLNAECNMNSILCRAIAARAVIEFAYEGGPRTAEPHIHGVSTAGNEVLQAYQVAGFSKSGNPQGWKLFEVSKMGPISVLEERFPANRPGYNPADRHMSRVHCHV